MTDCVPSRFPPDRNFCIMSMAMKVQQAAQKKYDVWGMMMPITGSQDHGCLR